MSRAAHPKQVMVRAHELRGLGHGYRTIKRALWAEFQIDVGESTIRDWVTYWSRQP